MNKYNIGDVVWVYDFKHGEYDFFDFKVDTIRVDNGNIIYNGKYFEEDCCETLKSCQAHALEVCTEKYKENCRIIEEKYFKKESEINNARKKFE